MITRTTLKTLWLAGGGVLATWLAVSPNHGVPTTTPVATSQRPSQAADNRAEEFKTQSQRLRSRVSAVTLRQSTRNPFRFNEPKPGAKGSRRTGSPGAPAPTEPSALTAPAPPLLVLSGIAETKTPEGARRTAVISAAGQVYLVGVGESVAGIYTVVTIDPEAIVLRGATGAELRLVLRP